MIILAIETSCDETAVSVIEFKNHKVRILAEVISSQVKLHAPYGGVVPALAAREHLKNFVPVLKRALKKSRINLSLTPPKRGIKKIPLAPFYKGGNVDYIAVTNGPGLIPALMIGVSAAKTLAYTWQKPLIPIHHIEGHIYSNWLRKKLEIGNWKKREKLEIGNWKLRDAKRQVGRLMPYKKLSMQSQNDWNWNWDFELWRLEFPILCLIISGGHTQLILMKKDLNYRIIGETRDDAAGEAFDKVAKLLGLSYPGGPIIEKLAKKGDKNKFKFPRPMINSGDFNFSFSGLKTAVLYKWKLVISNWKLGNKEKKLEIGNWKKREKLEIGNWKLRDAKRQVGRLMPYKKLSMQSQNDWNWNWDFELWRLEFPILCLIISGGHTQLILMKKDLNYRIIGETRDDAAGEAFDKVAKLLGLSYPGGPIIEKLAKKGDKNKFKFPRPMINSGDFNFSFSGLKTAVLYKWKLGNGTDKTDGINMAKEDVAASFQQAVIDVLIFKTLAAAKKYKAKSILLGGGVSANKELQRQFREMINKKIPNTRYLIPDTKLSTDNATMIAVAAYYHIINKKSIKSWKRVKADANLKL